MSNQANEKKPNIVLILADDLGYRDLIIKCMHIFIIRLICGKIVERLSCQVIMIEMKAKSIHTTVFSRKPAILSVKIRTNRSFVMLLGHFRMDGILFREMIPFGRFIKINLGQVRLRL